MRTICTKPIAATCCHFPVKHQPVSIRTVGKRNYLGDLLPVGERNPRINTSKRY